MKHTCSFLTFQEDEKDILVSFVIEDSEKGVISLILHRSMFYEYLLPEEERGVKVSLEGDEVEEPELNILESIGIAKDVVEIKAKFRNYQVNVSHIEEDEFAKMVSLVEKQNSDGRFSINVL